MFMFLADGQVAERQGDEGQEGAAQGDVGPDAEEQLIGRGRDEVFLDEQLHAVGQGLQPAELAADARRARADPECGRRPCVRARREKMAETSMIGDQSQGGIDAGGVSASNAADYIAAGAFALGVGGDLVNAAALREGNLAKITQGARELVETVRAARGLVLEKAALPH